MIDFIKLMDPKILKFEKSDQFFEDSEWIMERKINGRRIQCLIDDDVSFAGRYARDANEDIHNFQLKFQRVYEDVTKMQLPKGTLFDGEIYLPGRPSSLTFSIINSDIDDSVRLQEQHGFLAYAVFDILAFDNRPFVNQTLRFRKNRLQQILKPTLNVEIVDHVSSFKDKQKLWAEILDSNCEEKGVVFKFLESDYESSRSKWWRKLKRFETYDAVITGFNLDKNYPSDFVSSINVSQYRRGQLIHVANVSGLTKDQSADFRSRIEFFTNKVIQFRAESKTANSYKNPLYDRVRFDKQPQSCIW